MRKKNSKRLTAILLAAVLVMGYSVTIDASEAEANKVQETSENSDRTDIIQVVMPVNSEGIFDFILDPQELINKTNAAAYQGKKFEEGATLFFERFDGETEEDYSSTSDAVSITNRGNVPVDIIVSANILASPSEAFVMTDDREFMDDTRASLYLALTDGETTMPILTEEGVTLRATIPEAPEGGDSSYAFRLTGAANRKGDWSKMKNVEFEVTVTWMITPYEEEAESEDEDADVPDIGEVQKITPDSAANQEATPSTATDSDTEAGMPFEEDKEPSVGTPSYVLSEDRPVDIEVDLGTGNAAATEIVSVWEEGSDKELLGDPELASYSDGRIMLEADYVNSLLAEESYLPEVLVITFNDTASTKVEITLERKLTEMPYNQEDIIM